MTPRILAITLNWRQPEMTLACVRALQEAGAHAATAAQLDVLVIDNGSGDGSAAVLAAQQGDYRLLALPRNVGFAAGNNHGLRLALEEGYDYALLVNNDAFAAPDMVARLLAEARPDVGLLSPKIYYESDPTRIWFGNGRQHPLTLDLRDSGLGQRDGPAFAYSRDADYLLGTCLLVQLAAVRQVGLLDERYFMYFEDLDWSIRFRQAGYRLRLVAGAHLYHRVAISTGGADDTAPRRYYLAYSSVLFWRRYAHLGAPWAIVPFRLLSAVKMVTRLAVQGKGDVAAAYLRGLRDGWRESGRPVRAATSGTMAQSERKRGSMQRFTTQRKLELMPQWLRTRIEVNWYESQRLLEQAREQVAPGARLLDAGSGQGRYKHYFDHTQYVGVDLGVGDETWDYSGLDAVGDLRDLPFPDASFDAAVCVQTLEHVNDPFKVIGEIGRVLRPGGRFYLSAPMMWHQHQKPHDFFRYTSFGFQHLLQESGMRVVEMRPMGGYFWFLSFNLQMLHFWLFPRVERRWQWWLQLPFQLAVQAVTFVLLPVLLFYLDRIDTVKDHTMGWVCIAERVGGDRTAV